MSDTTSSPAFAGLWLPLITPMRNGAVDHAALTRLISHYLPRGITGLVICGSTGEAAALDDTEQHAVLTTALDAAQGLPVIMGLSGYQLKDTLARARALAAYPLAGVLVSAPMYIRPSQEGARHWFNAIADASRAPVVLYDIPYRTGAHLATQTLLGLAEHGNILAIKDCGGDAAKTQALIAQRRLQVLAGDEEGILPTLHQGGAGAIVACAHLLTEQFAALIEQARLGPWHDAYAQWQTLKPVVEAAYAEPNPAAFKWALARLGLIEDGLRAPMTNLSAAGAQRLRQALSAAGLSLP